MVVIWRAHRVLEQAQGRAARSLHNPRGRRDAVAVTDDPDFDWNPVWSPDGKYLYFASDRGGQMNLWRVPIEESTGKVTGSPSRYYAIALRPHVSFYAMGDAQSTSAR